MKRRLRIGSVFAAAALAVLAGAVVRAADLAAIVEVKSLSRLVAEVDAAAGALQMPSPRAALLSGLDTMLSVPGLAGIDTNKAVYAYVFLPDASAAGVATPVVLSLPVTGDGAGYLGAVSKAFDKSEKLGAVSHFSGRVVPLPGAPPDLYVLLNETVALAGFDAQTVQVVADRIRQDGAAPLANRVLPGTVRASIDVQAVRPMIEAGLTAAMAGIKQATAGQAAPGAPDASAILNAEGDALLAMLKEVKTFMVGVSAEGTAVDLYTGFTPMPETLTARILAGIKPPSASCQALVPEDALLAVTAGGMDAMDQLIEPYCAMIEKMFAAAGSQAGGLGDVVRRTMVGMKGMYAGDVAAAVTADAGQGIGFVEVIAVTDGAKAREFMVDTLTRYNELFGGLLPGVKLAMNLPRTHAGTEVLSYVYNIDAAASPAPQTPFPKLFSAMKGEMAFVGNQMIYAMGPAPVMDAMIDRVKAAPGQPVTPRVFSRLFPKQPANPVMSWSVAPLKLLKQALGSVPGANLQMLAMMPDSDSGIAGYSMKTGGEMLGVMRVSLQEVAAIKNSALVIGGLFAQTMAAGMNPAAPAGGAADPQARCIANLRALDAAKEQCALERNLADGAAVKEEWLAPFLKDGKLPACPAGGAYRVNLVGKPPTCSAEGHALP